MLGKKIAIGSVVVVVVLVTAVVFLTVDPRPSALCGPPHLSQHGPREGATSVLPGSYSSKDPNFRSAVFGRA